MVGQEKILETVKTLIDNNKFPKFMLLQGARGWGKTQLVREIAKLKGVDLVTFENKVDDLRECIKLAYEQTSPIIYVLTGGDTMSVAAKNSILKLIEEPPLNAYIIMLVENEETVLPTIRSRAFMLKMDSYTQDDIRAYLVTKDNAFTQEELDKIINICNCPGEANLLMQSENAELLDLVDKLLDNIDKVTLSNLLKISKKFKINDASEGMDITLFLNCVQFYLFNRYLKSKDKRCYKSYIEVVSTRKMLRANTTNKLYTLDSLLTEMWKIWNYGN